MVNARRMALASAIFWAFELSGATARAERREEDTRQTDFSAATIAGGDVRAGLLQIEVGIFDEWTVGTYTYPWFLPIVTSAPSGDLYTKVRLFELDRFVMAASGGVFVVGVDDFDRKKIGDTSLSMTVLPLHLVGTYEPARPWRFSLEATWVQSFLLGDWQSTKHRTATGFIAGSGFQMAAVAEFQLSSVVGLHLIGRVAPYSSPAHVVADIEVDTQTAAFIDVDVWTQQVPWLIQPGVHLAWHPLHVRVGLGYGSLFLPGLSLMTLENLPVPDLDLYFVF